MIIGQLYAQRAEILLRPSGPGSALHTFFLASRQADLSYYGIFNSAYATPARYLHEIVIRIREQHPTGRIHIVNPLYSLNYLHMLQLLDHLQGNCKVPGNCVVADADNHLLCYVLDSTYQNFHLSLLSTVDATLDARFLTTLLREPVSVQNVTWKLGAGICYNRLYSTANLDIYTWTAEHAVSQLDHIGAAKLPLTAVMPYHAGDAIFFALAAVRTPSPIDSAVVCSDYIDIVAQHAPHLACVNIDLPPPYRKGWEISEEDYFLQHLHARLPSNHLYVYLRPSGDYNRTTFHLIDHFSFALGNSPRRMDELLWLASNVHAATGKARTGKRILLHFDAGWPLKVYPEEKQQSLIAMLLSRGFTVTVLAKADQVCAGYREVAFRSYPHLVQLLQDVDCLVGMDSFPAHLATHSLGIPTICLFSSTRPANSNAPISSRYVHLEQGLNCRPCYAMTRCPRFGGEACRNFAESVEVMEHIERMLSGISMEIPALDYAYPKEIVDSQPSIGFRPAAIDLRHVKRSILLNRLNPVHHLGYAKQLYSEYVMAFRRQGIHKATYKALRFVFRLLARWSAGKR